MNFSRKQLSSLLGLTFDGNTLEGVVVRRRNGSVTVQNAFTATLALDPLTNDAELVGREIRNHLDAAGIREKNVAVNVPSNWVLTLNTRIPQVPEEDIESYLQIEAERGFPYSPDSLLISNSRYKTASGELFASQCAIPRDHILRLEQALKAAKLKAVTFGIGIAALQPKAGGTESMLVLEIGEKGVVLAVLCDGGIASVRVLAESVSNEAGQRVIYSDVVARECRITLGQLPAEVREALRHVKVFGPPRLAQKVADETRPRFETLGLRVEAVSAFSNSDFSVEVPSAAPLNSAFALATRRLAGQSAGFEFLPPKVNQWQQLAARYSSRKLVPIGAGVAAVLLILGVLFGYQHWQLSRLKSEWARLSPRVNQVEDLQAQIRKFRPWFDESLPSLNILRRLTEAFPADGVVTAKTLEVRELANVTCSGTARDNQSLLKTLEQLRGASEVSDVKIDQLRGNSPLQFTFNFHWGESKP